MSNLWTALLAFFQAIWPSIAQILELIGAAKAGQELQQGEDAQHEIEVLGLASDAVRNNIARPVDDRLHNAEERGLYRVYDVSPDDKQG